MGDSPTTRPSLLVRIRDAGDGPAWSQFVEVYAPLVYGFARKHGLQDADAADLTQDVLRAVAGASRKLEYDPNRGSFRGYLFTVVRSKLSDFRHRQRRRIQGTGDTAMQNLLNEQPAHEVESQAAQQVAQWDREFEQRLFMCAADRVRADVQPATWEAFRKTAVEGQEPKQVAKELQMTVANVYLAKSRVMARLKEQIKVLQEQ